MESNEKRGTPYTVGPGIGAPPAPDTPPPVFVVNSGRCGSTMLAAMMRANPRWIVMSEYLSYLTSRALSRGTLSGEEYWHILAEQSPVLKALHLEGMREPEILYEPGVHGPYPLHEAPAIMLATLPFLSEEPGPLLDALEAAVRPRPRGPIAGHMRAAFAALAAAIGRKVVIERTGDSLLLAGRLTELFPDARFVHLHRDGRDVAISMSRKPDFRAKVSYFRTLRRIGLDPYRPRFAYGVAPWHEWIERIGSKFLSVRHFTDAEMGPSECGRHWSWMIEAGARVLSRLGADRVLEIGYRELAEQPAETLRRIGAFIDPAGGGDDWIGEAASLSNGHISYWRDASGDAAAGLERACRPGLDILGYA